MLKWVVAALVALGALPASARSVCEMRGTEILEVFEAPKAFFLKGDYIGFADQATEVMRGARANLDAPIAQMKGLFPNGFESCQTVLQRRDAGGLVQEISTFNIAGSDFPMSLYLAAMPIRDEWQIVHLMFDTSFTKVMGNIR